MGAAGETVVNLIRGTMTRHRSPKEKKIVLSIVIDTRHVWLFRIKIKIKNSVPKSQ